MMPIILTPLRKGLRVVILRGRTEHSRVGAIPGDALTFEIRDVFRKRRRAKSLALMANDPSQDDDPPTWRTRSKRERGTPTPPKRRTALTPAAPKLLACMSGFPGGPHDLADEALWSFGAPVSVPDATGPNINLVVAPYHGDRRQQNAGRWRSTR